MDPSSIALVAFSSVIVLTAASFIAIIKYRAYCVKPDETPVTTINTIEIKAADWK